jgi:signal transduction histidine kinase/CheY-like chemotaxis protein
LAENLSQLLIQAETVELDELLVVSLLLVPMLIVVLWRQQVRSLSAVYLQGIVESERASLRALREEIDRRIEVEDQLRNTVRENESHIREIQSIYDTAPIGIASVDCELRYIRINQRLADMNGIPQAAHIGRSIAEMLPHLAEQIVPLYRSVIDTGRPVLILEFESTMPADPDRMRSWLLNYYPRCDAQGTITGVNAIVYETTERKQMLRDARQIASEMERVQKLEGLDILVGGIAHDFNNLLMVILSNIEFSLEDADISSATRECLAEANNAGRRAATVCRELLTYTGRSKPVLELFDLNELVNSVERMMRSTTPPHVDIHIDRGPTNIMIDGDESQISQVIMNLVINAIYAIGDRPGRIDLALGIDPMKNNVRFTCQDTGCGMTAETLSRVFEPFFTSKQNGRGLGLSASRGILKRHSGSIMVESQLNIGTTFIVTLPLASGTRPSGTITMPSWRGHADHVYMVVDDDPMVRRVTVTGLKKRGAEVIEAINGEVACELAVKETRAFAGFLIDYHMPGIDGVQTYQTLRRHFPAIPVIIISGNPVRAVEDSVAQDPHASVLIKPFSISYVLELFDTMAGRPQPHALGNTQTHNVMM